MSDESGGGGRSVRLSVPEMDCPSCAGKVEKALRSVDGVGETDLRPTMGVATVRFDPERTSEAEIRGAVERAGYTVEGNDGDAEEGDDEAAFGSPRAVWSSGRAKKTWVGAVFLVAGLVVEFLLAGLNPQVASVLGYPLSVSSVLYLATVVVSGGPIIRSGYYSARNRSLDIDFLMTVAILAAALLGQRYLVDAAVLAVLYNVAELLEDYSIDRARDSLRELLELSPDEATVRRDGAEVVVPAEDVAVGETVLVRPGEKIPVDGTVVEGRSAVDESPITGESVPAEKAEGDEVYAGSITEGGYLEVEATADAGESTLSRIIELVQEAQSRDTEMERFVDRFAGYYTPVIVALAILTAVGPPLAFGEAWRPWAIRGITFLVIGCPCAFVISTPVAVVSALTSAARNGVLIEGGDHLEAMGSVGALALDKTGTLTKGELAVTDVVALGEHAEGDVLRRAAGLERRSEHPIAAAILARADEAGVGDVPEPSEFESLSGRGIRASFDGETYYAGTPALFEELGFDLARARRVPDGGAVAADEAEPSGLAGGALADLERDGKTVVLVGTASELVGVVGVADEIRPGAARAVERLRDLGVEHVVMLTGDNEGTARAIAEQVGVDDYGAELLPAEKVDAIEELQAEYETVAMVGDGINDAPALAAADVGVAMGAAGTDTAIETADVALMGDEIGKLPYLYALSNRANRVVRQNVGASLAVKALLAAGVPLGLVSVAAAVVVGDMGMSLGVTGNAMRLSRIRPDDLFD